MKKKYICISCPIGCELELEEIAKENIIVNGNKCIRGEIYAKEEYLSPKRVVTATCKILRNNYRLPVKTDKPILKEYINNLLKEIYLIEICPPIKVGDIIIKNYKDSGVDVISSKSVN
jgi:CxxC motif-containing protein